MVVEALSAYPVLEYLKEYVNMSNGIIAGGCFKDIFQDKAPRDYDIFFRTQDDYSRFVRHVKMSNKFEKLYESQNAIGVLYKPNNIKIELISCTFKQPKELLEGFDYTVTKFCVYKDSDWQYKILRSDTYFDDLTAKKLRLEEYNTQIQSKYYKYPFKSFSRMLKYASYGFSVDEDAQKKLFETIKTTHQDVPERITNESDYESDDEENGDSNTAESSCQVVPTSASNIGWSTIPTSVSSPIISVDTSTVPDRTYYEIVNNETIMNAIDTALNRAISSTTTVTYSF